MKFSRFQTGCASQQALTFGDARLLPPGPQNVDNTPFGQILEINKPSGHLVYRGLDFIKTLYERNLFQLE